MSDNTELKKCIQNYPFERILDVGLYEEKIFRKILENLIEICKTDYFYQYERAGKYTLEFIITNLGLFKDELPVDILKGLLEILGDIIASVKQRRYMNQINLNKDRIFEVLGYITQLKILGPNQAKVCKIIVHNLLSISVIKNLKPSSIKQISKIFQFFKNHFDPDNDLVQIGWLIIVRLPVFSEPFLSCATWLAEDCGKILENKNQEYQNDMVATLMRTLSDFQARYKCLKNAKGSNPLQKYFDQIIFVLMEISSEITRFARNTKYKNDATKLLGIVITEFVERENIVLKNNNILQEINTFSEEIREWPYTISRAFFLLCHLLYKHSKQYIWKPQKIIDSIFEVFYSRKGKLILPQILKSVCFIYPIVFENCISRRVIALGDDILRLLSRQASENVFSYHWAQFFWIMETGSRFNDLKYQLLIFWILNDKYTSALALAIVPLKLCSMVLTIIIENPDAEVVKRVVKISSSIQNQLFSLELASKLPYTLDNLDIFRRLILSKPAVPANNDLTMKILEVVSISIPLFSDGKTLKTICAYSIELLYSLRQMKRTLDVFCGNMSGIKYLLHKMEDVEEDAAVEIMNLLKTLVLIQKRNKVPVKNCTEIQIIPVLIKSQTKAYAALDFLRVICNFQETKMGFLSLIYLDYSSIQMVYITLLQLIPKFENANIYLCLAFYLKKDPKMASSAIFCSLIEEKCGQNIQKSPISSAFMQLLKAWTGTLNQNLERGFCYLPDIQIVKSYVLRCDSPQSEKVYILAELKKISKQQYLLSNKSRRHT